MEKNFTPEERLFHALFGEVEADHKTEQFLDRMTGHGVAGHEPLQYIDKHPNEIVALDSEGDDALGKETMLHSHAYVFKAILFAECCCPVQGLQDGVIRKFSEFYSAPARAWVDRNEKEIHRYLNEKEIKFLKDVMKKFGFEY